MEVEVANWRTRRVRGKVRLGLTSLMSILEGIVWDRIRDK
jgi:hypothetical protein